MATQKKHVIRIILQTETTGDDGKRIIDSQSITTEGANSGPEYLTKRRYIREVLEGAKATVVNAMEALEQQGYASGDDGSQIDWADIGQLIDARD